MISKKINIISPFGPKLAKIKLSKKIVKDINKEVDRIILNKRKSKKQDYSKKLVGEVYQEIELSKNFINKKLKRFIHDKVKNYLKNTINKSTNKINIKNFWIVRQFKNEYNPVHYHDGNISGVGYLKIPKNLNFSKKKKKTNGTIDFINGSRMFLNKSIYNHVPKVGDLILFPNYLMHTAYPFVVDGERRSFSFNIELDKKVADIFHD
tara:strand:+ start:447 stop:1070 length:624 start_codon:yes stop_codon:yes gene_type:complete